VITISVLLEDSLLVPVTWNALGAMPETASAAVTVATVTSFWFGGHNEQPAAGIQEITGAVLSMFTFAVAGVLTVPALSLQLPETVCPAPSAMTATGSVQESTPERLSVPANDTVAFKLIQPFAFRGGTTWRLLGVRFYRYTT